MIVQHGSLEVVAEPSATEKQIQNASRSLGVPVGELREAVSRARENVGVLITPAFPLDLDDVARQVRNRVGVDLGDPIEADEDMLAGAWHGRDTNGKAVEVRVWKTAE